MTTLDWKRLARAFRDSLLRMGVPKVLPKIVRVLPHDQRAFTQGLAYSHGCLYESTGRYEDSSLRWIDPRDGSIRNKVLIPDDFCEGIAVSRGRVYQLSWKLGRARVYRPSDLKQVDEHSYQGEGWGLASYPDGFIMSNGTSRIVFRDTLFRITRTLRLHSRAGLPFKWINDIEYVNGVLFANILHAKEIFAFSVESGKPKCIVDCSELISAAQPSSDESVLNGIAFDADHGTYFVTGKNWRYLFEVSFPDR